MNYKTIEQRTKKAIDTREKGELTKSRRLFESLLKDIKKLLEKDPSQELKNIYATAMGEYVIQHRLEAKGLYEKALDLGRRLLEYDRKNKLDNPLSIRSLSNTLVNVGGYEEAEPYFKQLIPLYKENSGRQGDTKAHLAYIYLRTGRLEKAGELIKEAILDIEKNTANEKYVSIWLPKALLVKSLILNARGKTEEALKYARKAMVVAKTDNRVFRIKQAQEIINYLARK